jgi:hypothetical protein
MNSSGCDTRTDSRLLPAEPAITPSNRPKPNMPANIANVIPLRWRRNVSAGS